MSRNTYSHTVSGLLEKRSELLSELRDRQERAAAIINSLGALDATLQLFGYNGALEGPPMKSARQALYKYRGLRRFIVTLLRKAEGPMTTRALADTILREEGKDPQDRLLREDMARRVSKSLQLMRKSGKVESLGTSSPWEWQLIRRSGAVPPSHGN